MNTQKIRRLEDEINNISLQYSFNNEYSMNTSQQNMLNSAWHLVEITYHLNYTAQAQCGRTLLGLAAILGFSYLDPFIGKWIKLVFCPVLFAYVLKTAYTIDKTNRTYAHARKMINELKANIAQAKLNLTK